jgi:hypothetical protein
VTDPLIDHLEAQLGPIAGGWSQDSAGVRLPFQVVWFADAPSPGITTFATLGLSKHLLGQPTSSDVRQELLLMAQDRFRSDRLVSALAAVGELVVERHEALPRGQTVPMGSPLVPGSSLDGFYATIPVILPDAFALLDSTDPPTVIAWLVPIAASELSLIESHGWRWFEARIEEQQPDLFDLYRDPIRH